MITTRSVPTAFIHSLLIALIAPFVNVGAVQAGAAQTGAVLADTAYLEKLLGRWDMTGTMGSKALHYHAVGERVLQGGFVRLHMVDADPNPEYEADVYIGADRQRHDFIAHWLDRFGAAGARVVGTGRRNDMQLVIIFPYVSGAFRDAFTFMPDLRKCPVMHVPPPRR